MSVEEVIEIKVNQDTIAVLVDEPQTSSCHGEVIVAPPFGVTAERMFSLSYFLTQNGFRVYRTDLRYHLGESTGTVENAKMSSQIEDVLAVMKETKCTRVISLSLSTRAALRACKLYGESVQSIMITPVVNVRSTLREACGEDIFENVLSGKAEGATVLGNYVKGEFVNDCVALGFETWADCVEDLSGYQGEITFIAGDSDPWVTYDHVENVVIQAQKVGTNIKLVPIRAASHKINRNPAVARTYFEAATRECLRMAGKTCEDMVVPNFKEIVRVVGEQRRSGSEKIGDLRRK